MGRGVEDLRSRGAVELFFIFLKAFSKVKEILGEGWRNGILSCIFCRTQCSTLNIYSHLKFILEMYGLIPRLKIY